MNIEILEPRIAPAVIINPANPKIATYTDSDGDHVTVKVSTGTLTSANFLTFITGLGEQMRRIALSAGGFDGADLTVSVVRVPGGDGLANVGYVNSFGHDLGKVSIQGDLGQIDAGDATATKPGVKSLTVESLGRLNVDTQSGITSLVSVIEGGLGTLVVKGDVVGAAVAVTGGADVKLGSVTVGGSLIGGTDFGSGRITSTGDMGAVKIGRDVQGGSGQYSGGIYSSGKLASLSIGGSLIGGSNDDSGEIAAGSAGVIKIAHDVQGGSGQYSGKVSIYGALAGVSVGGSLIGGSNYQAGSITSLGDIAAVKIGDSVRGGAGTQSGIIEANNSKLAAVTIGGSLIAGSVAETGNIAASAIGTVKIGHDVRGGAGNFSGLVTGGEVAAVTIGGSLIGGTGSDSGKIRGLNGIGTVKIGHDVLGGSGFRTGFIGSDTGKIAGVTIGGSLIGGPGGESGRVHSDTDMGPIKIGHDILGGTNINDGTILAGGNLASVTLGGSLIGASLSAGVAINSGVIASFGDIGPVKIGHDFIGGSITGSALLQRSGYIQSSGRIASVTIGGSIIAGIDDSSDAILAGASIRADDDIGSFTVKGSLIGNSTANGFSPVIISARGQAVQGATTDLAIGKVTIGGRVEFSYVLAGYDHDLAAKNADAQIGAVKVGGTWAASNLVAGAQNQASMNTRFGNLDDFPIGGGDPDIISKIASITIGGRVFGTPVAISNTDRFGFVAEHIGSFKAAGITIPLVPGPHTDTPPLRVGETTDTAIHEV